MTGGETIILLPFTSIFLPVSDHVPSLPSDSFASYIPDKDIPTETQFLLKDFGIEIVQL